MMLMVCGDDFVDYADVDIGNYGFWNDVFDDVDVDVGNDVDGGGDVGDNVDVDVGHLGQGSSLVQWITGNGEKHWSVKVDSDFNLPLDGINKSKGKAIKITILISSSCSNVQDVSQLTVEKSIVPT